MGECSPQNAAFFARQTRVLLLSGGVKLKICLRKSDREVLPVPFFTWRLASRTEMANKACLILRIAGQSLCLVP